MGTRADFYVGRGKTAEWIGSTAYDGFPGEFPKSVTGARTEAGYRRGVAAMLASRDDATTPEQGWPWPWEDSNTTDYSYAFDDKTVWYTASDGNWYDASKPEVDVEYNPNAAFEFPNMKDRQNVTFGQRSGILLIRG